MLIAIKLKIVPYAIIEAERPVFKYAVSNTIILAAGGSNGIKYNVFGFQESTSSQNMQLFG